MTYLLGQPESYYYPGSLDKKHNRIFPLDFWILAENKLCEQTKVYDS